MRFFPMSVALGAAALLAFAPAASRGEEPARIEAFTLKDQHDRSRSYDFPRPKLSVLTAADWKGSEQIEGWITPLFARYGTRLEYWGVADMAAVPEFLRGYVEGKFREKLRYSVLLDWDGKTATKLLGTKECATILIVTPGGEVRHRVDGKQTPAGLKAIFATIDRELEK